jgi:hypothetical protein
MKNVYLHIFCLNCYSFPKLWQIIVSDFFIRVKHIKKLYVIILTFKDDKKVSIKKSSLDVSSKVKTSEWPTPIKNIELTPTEQKVYLKLSIEFQIVLDEAPSFQTGAYRWQQILPKRLEKYSLTLEEWTRISEIGDTHDALQEQLSTLLEQLEDVSS